MPGKKNGSDRAKDTQQKKGQGVLKNAQSDNKNTASVSPNTPEFSSIASSILKAISPSKVKSQTISTPQNLGKTSKPISFLQAVMSGSVGDRKKTKENIQPKQPGLSQSINADQIVAKIIEEKLTSKTGDWPSAPHTPVRNRRKPSAKKDEAKNLNDRGSEDRLRVEPIFIGNRNIQLQALPNNFTCLNIKSREEGVMATPDRGGGRNSRMASTTPAVLLGKLYSASQEVKSINKALRREQSNDIIKGNLACAQLSIIPRDRSKEELFLNITSEDSKSNKRIMVTPFELYGRSQHTFKNFSALHQDYLDKDLLSDSVVKKILGGVDRSDSSDEIEEAGTKIRIKTHHSEQFFIAAIYKTLLALKDAGSEFSDTSFILDISTRLAPCNHCVNRINDFFDHIKSELFPDNNYFVVRISWLESYLDGQSPSDISLQYEDRSTELSDEYVDITDSNKNYVLAFKATEQIAAASNILPTKSGRAAETSIPVSSSNNKYMGVSKKTALSISVAEQNTLISPPRQNSVRSRSEAKNIKLAKELSAGISEVPNEASVLLGSKTSEEGYANLFDYSFSYQEPTSLFASEAVSSTTQSNVVVSHKCSVAKKLKFGIGEDKVETGEISISQSKTEITNVEKAVKIEGVGKENMQPNSKGRKLKKTSPSHVDRLVSSVFSPNERSHR
ncbi:MAG: hypothetical protein HOM96_00030 [Rickettsiales bacterium]|jgi:hypothetical protein|nr:hypothetical protein [Rickettsiales bacterium]